jgi:predicted nucleic acid-binding protein
MENVFIDTDVIIDFLIDRKPFSIEAAKIFSLIDQKKIKGSVSSISFSNLYYVLRKIGSHKKVISSLQKLSEFVDILKVDSEIIKSALLSDFKDFEDSIQYFTALENKKIDYIITRNIRDFREVSLPVMTPETFLATFVS